MKHNFQTGDWEGQLRTKHMEVETSSCHEVKYFHVHEVKYLHVIGVPWKNETEKQEETSCCFQQSTKYSLHAALLYTRSQRLIPYLMIGILQDKQVS